MRGCLKMVWRQAYSLSVLMVVAVPSNAQVNTIRMSAPRQLPLTSGVVVGQRQTTSTTVPATIPGSRTNNRINSRVQSRIRNRIDRNYDPQANALSPFNVADDQIRSQARP